MSQRHPIIAITGSSGAGTTSVMETFSGIFRREGVDAQFIEGDSFHRYDRKEMANHIAESGGTLSHFGPEANLFSELEQTFASYSETGSAKARKYLHKPATDLKWGTKIEFDGVMDLVTVEDAIAAFERYRADAAGGTAVVPAS